MMKRLAGALLTAGLMVQTVLAGGTAIDVGVGHSLKEDSFEAGKESITTALKAMKGRSPKVVLVFHHVNALTRS